MEPQQILPAGITVYGADGEPIGTVVSAEELYAVVETGDFPAYLYVPFDAIVETREDGAYLSVTESDARRQGWDRTPTGEAMPLSAEELGAGPSEIEIVELLESDPGARPE